MGKSSLGFALALVLAAPAVAQQTLNVRDADIRAFIQDAARVTGRTFIIDQRVQGRVSVSTDRPLSRSEYFEAFLATLRANGLVAVPTAGGAFRVQPVEGAATTAGRVGAGGAPANSFVTEVFRLRSVDATQAVETIRPLVSREGSVTASRSANSIVVADFADNLRRIRELVRRIDTDGSATRIVPLENAGAREIAQSLTQLLQGPGQAGGTGLTATVVPVDSANAIAIRGDAATVARLVETARELDRRAESGTEIRVIYLEHADAAQLLPVLQQLTGQPVTPVQQQQLSPSRSVTGGGEGGSLPTTTTVAQSAAPVSGGGGNTASALGLVGRGPAIVTRFEGANAIIIAASGETQRLLGEVVRQLDTRREQVLVEAIVVEISDTTANRLGVQFLLGGVPGSGVPFAVSSYSNSAPNLLAIAGAIGARELNTTTTVTNGGTVTTTTDNAISNQLAQTAINSILGAGAGIFGFGTEVGDGGIFGTIINAVRADSQSNLLSTPSIQTLDNTEARILVGQEIPVTTGEALSGNFDNAFRTVQRQNVGIQLEVRPQVNAGGEIKLFLRQEVSSISGAVSNDNSDLILNKREIETTITVQDGQIAVLGGLLDDNERNTIEKIPFLGDLPAIGALFRSRARQRSKTNLMVFIRPTIIRSPNDQQIVTERRYGYVRRQQLEQQPTREPTLDELVRDYMGAPVPVPPEPQPGSFPAPLPPSNTLPPPVLTEPGEAALPETVVPRPLSEQTPRAIVPEMRSSTTVVRPVIQAPR